MGIVLFLDWLISETLQNGELIELMPDMKTAIKTEPQNIALFILMFVTQR
ncbi:LysR family transcriptional regulator [Salmonella enterica subsp. salamae]|uniref:LysR family transcriptional regulator n=1 Tax=Salmonella enterica subsp. salamae TaxID=59202 RepID=A0A6D2GBN7_SALER|nr:LysR family transcriptional regulator [Salmonella enterica subsp. salamae]